MLNLLGSLDCRLYKPGDNVCTRNEKIHRLILLAEGSCNLYGYCEVRGVEHKIALSHLPERSWYGDFQILLEVQSTFQLEAANYSSKRNKSSKEDKSRRAFIRTFSLAGHKFVELSNSYPSYR